LSCQTKARAKRTKKASNHFACSPPVLPARLTHVRSQRNKRKHSRNTEHRRNGSMLDEHFPSACNLKPTAKLRGNSPSFSYTSVDTQVPGSPINVNFPSSRQQPQTCRCHVGPSDSVATQAWKQFPKYQIPGYFFFFSLLQKL